MQPSIEHNGVLYHYHNQKGYYFHSNGITTLSLHREIYKDHYGDIPDGMEIHHIDFNPLNNNLENLQLLTKFQHQSLHMKKRWEKPEWGNCVKKYNNHEVCVERGKLSAKKRIQKLLQNKKETICEVCGEKTITLTYAVKKYCSDKCKTRAWRLSHKEV